MTIEHPYVLNEGIGEQLTVYQDRNGIYHRLNGEFIQRFIINKSVETDDNYLEYDWYKGDLWVGLMLWPDKSFTILSDFYLGRKRPDGTYHAIRFSIQHKKIQYYSYRPFCEPTLADLRSESDVDWRTLHNGKTVKVSEIKTRFCNEPATGELSFAYRLLPGSISALAQVSTSGGFSAHSALTLDTSFRLDIKTYNYLMTEAKRLIEGEKKPDSEGIKFIDHIQIAFSPYFPMS